MGIKKKAKTLQLTEAKVEALMDEYLEEGDISEDGEWEMVEPGEWMSDGKYDLCNSIMKHIPTGKYYQVNSSRTGSYYTDYDYQYDGTLYEVEPKEVTITTWKVVYEE